MREYGFLFSIPGQAEAGGEEQGGLVEGEAVDGGPEVEDVAVGGAVGLEALEDIFAEVDRAGRLAGGRIGCRGGMEGTGAAALLRAALEEAQDAQVFQDLVQGDLLAEESEVDFGSVHAGRRRLTATPPFDTPPFDILPPMARCPRIAPGGFVHHSLNRAFAR